MHIGSDIRPARLGATRIAAVMLAALVAGAGAGIALHFVLAGSPRTATADHSAGRLYGQATWAAGARAAPPITTLRDQSGHLFSLSSLRGRTAAVVFFDS